MGPCLTIHIVHEVPHVYLQPLNAYKGIFVCGLNLHPMALWNIRYFSKHFSNIQNIAKEIGKYLQNFDHEIECMVILYVSSSSHNSKYILRVWSLQDHNMLVTYHQSILFLYVNNGLFSFSKWDLWSCVMEQSKKNYIMNHMNVINCDFIEQFFKFEILFKKPFDMMLYSTS